MTLPRLRSASPQPTSVGSASSRRRVLPAPPASTRASRPANAAADTAAKIAANAVSAVWDTGLHRAHGDRCAGAVTPPVSTMLRAHGRWFTADPDIVRTVDHTLPDRVRDHATARPGPDGSALMHESATHADGLRTRISLSIHSGWISSGRIIVSPIFRIIQPRGLRSIRAMLILLAAIVRCATSSSRWT